MVQLSRFSNLKSFLIQAAAGVAAAAITAFLGAPEQQLQFGTLAVGLIAIPLFLLGGVGAIFLYGLYLVVHIVEVLATKLDIIDMVDGL
jgi:hypothetical protein